MRNKYILFVSIILASLCFGEVQCQQPDAHSPDYGFINYLINNEQYDEALHLLNQYSNDPKHTSDSIRFYKGKIFYLKKELYQSFSHMNSVSSKSQYFFPAHFLAAYSLAHQGDLQESEKLFYSLQPADSLLKELKYLELSGIALLKRDLELFEDLHEQMNYNFYQLETSKDKLFTYYEDLRDFNAKSPALAGIMSAIIPGSGKIYTGKVGEGITSLLGLTVLGFITYENYKKAGPANYKTITFGSLFALFYTANIYGSIISVKVYRDEFNKRYDHKILFNMHIPVRNVFSKAIR